MGVTWAAGGNTLSVSLGLYGGRGSWNDGKAGFLMGAESITRAVSAAVTIVALYTKFIVGLEVM